MSTGTKDVRLILDSRAKPVDLSVTTSVPLPCSGLHYEPELFISSHYDNIKNETHIAPFFSSVIRSKIPSSVYCRERKYANLPASSIRHLKGLREELLVGSLLPGSSRGSLGLHRSQLVSHSRVGGHQLVSGLEVLESSLLVLQMDAGKTSSVQGLGTVLVGDASDSQSGRGEADGIVPLQELGGHESRVGAERVAEGVKLTLGLGGLVVQLRLLVEVADALLVLLKREVVVAALEGDSAIVLAGSGNFEDRLGAGIGRLIVLGVVLVRITQSVGLPNFSNIRSIASKLAAVDDGDQLAGRILFDNENVLSRANGGLSVEDAAEDNVLVVKMRSGNGGNEELGTVGVCRYR